MCILGRVASGATVLKGKRGDAGTMPSHVLAAAEAGDALSTGGGLAMTTNPMPKAKTERLIVTQIDGETLVYDRARDAASCLNALAAKVWWQCDGETSVAGIAAALGEDERAVWLALHHLTKSQLLTEAIALPPEMTTAKSRREVTRRLGLGAAAFVASIVVSTTAAHASCGRQGSPCTTTADCCTGPFLWWCWLVPLRVTTSCMGRARFAVLIIRAAQRLSSLSLPKDYVDHQSASIRAQG